MYRFQVYSSRIEIEYAQRYQPAMRLAGATRAHARGVTDCRIGSDGWLDLFIRNESTSE